MNKMDLSFKNEIGTFVLKTKVLYSQINITTRKLQIQELSTLFFTGQSSNSHEPFYQSSPY